MPIFGPDDRMVRSQTCNPNASGPQSSRCGHGHITNHVSPLTETKVDFQRAAQKACCGHVKGATNGSPHCSTNRQQRLLVDQYPSECGGKKDQQPIPGTYTQQQ